MFHTFVHNVAPSIPCPFRAARPGTMVSATVIGDPNERAKLRSRRRKPRPKHLSPLRKDALQLRYKKMGIMAGAHYTLGVQDCQKSDLDYILP